jgi:ribonuclease-3
MDKHMDELQISNLQKKLNYNFNDPALLIKALTHSSFANEGTKKDSASNERLEFLGDSLLGMTVALFIFNRKPELSEGQMTKLRAELVCERSLAELALELDLGTYILLGRGEKNTGGSKRPSILSDAIEAIIAAIYLDGGFEPVKQFVSDTFAPRLNSPSNGFTDYKTRLQETIQGKQGQTLVYELIDELGPDHDKSFTVDVKLNSKTLGTGKGKSKKRAEQEAAKAAINILETRKE